jgi:hypothetical protein
MSAKKMFSISLVLIAVFTALVITLFFSSTQAQARLPLQVNESSQCVTCHEDLYYLHDTGKAYCLKDASMTCVDCHGGDPTAQTKEAAHFNRAVHPVINDDDKKCYECHPAQAETRLAQFSQVAGISEIKVAATCEPASVPVTAGFPESKPEKWVLSMEAISLFVVAGLALAVFIAFKIRH